MLLEVVHPLDFVPAVVADKLEVLPNLLPLAPAAAIIRVRDTLTGDTRRLSLWE